ncbi:dynein axonemal heavy chain 12-like isoform X2 [Acipenser ruthenus]|uniref:dynein axonemal heavy chain 12-like isoform X2 n=1 Tax=Acipenser ruthenus TaxID=7906 RepID=UPI002740325A|nr:dynein axonemal heavy chain 12-like isoform X2 [Acipenser ruthenus]
MEPAPSGDEWDDDIANQYSIEESLQELHKRGGYRPAVKEEGQGESATDNEKVIAAIKAGDEDALCELTVHRHAFEEADKRGWLPIHEAAAQSNTNILKLTFQASSPSVCDPVTLRGETPLFLAVDRGLRDNATFLLLNNCSPNTKNLEEDSPIVAAVKNGSCELLSLLIRFGADVNQQGVHRRTALHEAARLGRRDTVDLLLRCGADPDPRSSYGLTPLALAAQCGHTDIVQALLQKGVSVESQALDSASILFEAAASGNPDTIALLLEYGADANVPKYSGHLPIHRAAYRGHLHALKLLIPVTERSAVKESGMSPLHSAAAGGHPQCLALLLQAGYDVNVMLDPHVRRGYDDLRKSALFFAVSNGDLACVQLLLEAGALPNQDPVNSLQVALRLGNHPLISLLLRHGANVNYYCRVNTTHYPSALQYALKDEVVLRMLLGYGYDVQRCFHCPYGDQAHLPADYEGWSSAVIKDTMFCEVITLNCLKDISGKVVRIMLDYVDHVPFCSKLKAVLIQQKQWPEIQQIQQSPRCLKHLCRLQIRGCLGRLRLRAPVFLTFLPLPNRLKDFLLYREYDVRREGPLQGSG